MFLYIPSFIKVDSINNLFPIYLYAFEHSTSTLFFFFYRSILMLHIVEFAGTCATYFLGCRFREIRLVKRRHLLR